MHSLVKALLDEEWKIRKLELGESSGHARETVEKQTDLVDSVCWELLKMVPPGGGTCGSTSASTDKDACPPRELSVAAMKPDGSVTTKSFKPCQLLPEQWTPLAFDKLLELYNASVAQHAQEKVTLLKLHAKAMAAAAAQHAQEKIKLLKLHAQGMAVAAVQHKQELKLHAQGMAAAAIQHKQELKLHKQGMAAATAQHKQEMAAAAARHAQEMAAVKRKYNLEYLGNLDQMCDDMDCDQPGFSGDTHM
ncbi:hypothetical protein OIU79_022566 [Salix purpurea]|uniref:Uncharacterized protein n=1 Tax=Salix purpurea TaxID=77065 RepID=A0A9Q0WIT9_SALPP|nr:hypothetical protein OIU79_022566 [Salix purpurea]